MKIKSLVLSTGFAMFSMFFGSGNLVFPLVVGQMSKGHVTLAALGILLTGVLIPFLGIFVMLLFNGNSGEFFGRLGRSAPFWFSLIALSLMGPFGVLARCITVAHGAFKLLVPSTELWMFSMGFCAVIFLLIIRKNQIVSLLGSILTPILLFCLLAIGVAGLMSADLPKATLDGGWDGFKNGVFQGYQTMDLLAAFFFSVFVIKHLKKGQKENGNVLPVFLKASLIGAGLLSTIYLILVLLGAIYAPMLTSIPPEEILGFIANASLGKWAIPIVCCAVVLACLTTAIVLASLFADFLRKEVIKNKINNPLAIATTLGIAFFISTLQFSGIGRMIGPILEAIYPALIVFTVLSIFHKLWGFHMVRMPTALAFLAKLLMRSI